jgi:endonuclease YncB( thermonuclease family)
LKAALNLIVRTCLAVPLLASAAPHTWTGLVTLVVDGDTVHVRATPNAEPRSVRIQGIDAPESCQPHGRVATQALKDMALGRTVVVTTTQQDDYGRDLAVLHLGREDLGQRMVSAGHAWSYRFKKNAGPYAAQERQARQMRTGLFSDPAAEYPGKFRRRHGPCLWGTPPR